MLYFVVYYLVIFLADHLPLLGKRMLVSLSPITNSCNFVVCIRSGFLFFFSWFL